MKKVICFISTALIVFTSVAQELPVPGNIKPAIKKGTRTNNGRPGIKYWQNTANYDIQVRFDPATRLLTGRETITYFNNSPDTLKNIVFKLYPNLYKKGSPRLMKIADEDAGEGVTIRSMQINSINRDVKTLRIDATNMIVNIPAAAPSSSTNFEIEFSFVLNKGSHIRTGQVDSGAFFLAYYFPRIAVYDDIEGWNLNPYLGTQEFYNDFCNFKTSVTVPQNYVVWGTGDLTNASSVMNEKYVTRLQRAEKEDALSFIIDSADLLKKDITKPGENTWVFDAKNVTDAVFAISDHYLWQSSSLVVDSTTMRRTRVDAVFNNAHKDYFHVLSDARKTVEAMSFKFPKWPYPYNHETVFDGLDQMEYPMMVNDIPVDDRAESIELTDHEIFHTMFPFYMGINETKYAWMDEGWATIGEWLISPMIDTTIVDEYGMAATNRAAGTEVDMPVTTLTTQLSGAAMFINSYPKPALGYLYVKDYLGDELFYKGLHNYFRTWAGKHPLPNDFFYSMNVGSGKNLNWFWKKWFFDNGVPDLAIKPFVQRKNSTSKYVDVIMKGDKPVPVDITIFYQDGTSEKIHRSIAVWEKGSRTTRVNFSSSKKVKKITLGSTYTADVNKEDNVWEAGN